MKLFEDENKGADSWQDSAEPGRVRAEHDVSPDARLPAPQAIPLAPRSTRPAGTVQSRAGGATLGQGRDDRIPRGHYVSPTGGLFASLHTVEQPQRSGEQWAPWVSLSF